MLIAAYFRVMTVATCVRTHSDCKRHHVGLGAAFSPGMVVVCTCTAAYRLTERLVHVVAAAARHLAFFA